MFAQGAESAIVSAHIILILGFLHFIIISLAIFFSHPMGKTTGWVIFNLMPPAIFILCIIFNQIGIHYFNKLMAHTEYVPIVNTQEMSSERRWRWKPLITKTPISTR